jgi:hypothetical protein
VEALLSEAQIVLNEIANDYSMSLLINDLPEPSSNRAYSALYTEERTSLKIAQLNQSSLLATRAHVMSFETGSNRNNERRWKSEGKGKSAVLTGRNSRPDF